MISRFHFPLRLPESGEVALPDELAHHALRVLRLRDGESVILFDGEGGEVDAQLVVRGKAAFALLGERRASDRESPLQVVLVQALAAGDKMDWVVQKAVELGVSAIEPVQAERSVLRLAGERAEKRVAHWRQVAVAACEQSGRNRIPPVRPLQPLTQWLVEHRDALCYVLAPGGSGGFFEAVQPQRPIHVLIGPEGGWTDAELSACDAAGCHRVTLGPRVLRTETAGLVALAVLQARWGDL
ncbi:MAG TPA: 16S rRNA (uracil(1498)-N(3))-methyltransferase [Thauera sp.]|nr:16S rRNA (uracil(1498)-N(3))-methyltransferase [Thauera sp.]HRA80856.1 16S rRNA (uracil(1498)-N(3))-methyltransferase [Thauera sp.]